MNTNVDKNFCFVTEVIADFFKQEELQRKLALIYEKNITGWEIWLQIEFSFFLTQNRMIGEWQRETPLEFDRRKEPDKEFFRADFLLRKKYWPKESYVCLEMKQHPKADSCITAMLLDIHKVSKIRGSELDLRNFYALGVFEKEESTAILKEKILTKASRHDLKLEKSLIQVKRIKNTNYAYAVF